LHSRGPLLEAEEVLRHPASPSLGASQRPYPKGRFRHWPCATVEATVCGRRAGGAPRLHAPLPVSAESSAAFRNPRRPCLARSAPGRPVRVHPAAGGRRSGAPGAEPGAGAFLVAACLTVQPRSRPQCELQVNCNGVQSSGTQIFFAVVSRASTVTSWARSGVTLP